MMVGPYHSLTVLSWRKRERSRANQTETF